MSLKKTKDQLVKLLDQADNNVIAISGKWGTGKTHLWNEVKDESTDDRVKKALYVSLFGLSSVDQVKRKLIETAIPGVDSHGGVFDGIKSLFGAGVKALSTHYKALAALNDLNVLLMAPVVLRGPDGHPKLLHLWPVKLLQAGRTDGDYTGVAVMREAASFNR